MHFSLESEPFLTNLSTGSRTFKFSKRIPLGASVKEYRTIGPFLQTKVPAGEGPMILGNSFPIHL
ncbi:hypothetical protein A0128_02515 [Leptospira tipperaryensis]|uniref:Uncharacterized protein n=1 Tax=Leptospira tipperaryensis TaxID=2564040 RepID=A0A1D7UT94_9LEPT|nr:hypothetical protein A0128_02515 [Leptospira tipperaryensis]